jgi:hypothetical protein
MVSMHVSNLTVDELKALVDETVEQTLVDFLTDPEKGLALQQGMKTALKRSIKGVREGGALYSSDEVANNLELE